MKHAAIHATARTRPLKNVPSPAFPIPAPYSTYDGTKQNAKQDGIEKKTERLHPHAFGIGSSAGMIAVTSKVA